MMYLVREQIYTIMLVDKWSSDAFLAYIEKQVREFSQGVSSRMLDNNTFFSVPLASQPEENRQTNSRSFHGSSLTFLALDRPALCATNTVSSADVTLISSWD